jgi:hypothetical protein
MNIFLSFILGDNVEKENYNSSTAFVTTFLVQNYQDDRMNDVARAWEAEFRKFVENFPKINMTVSAHTPTF